MSENLKAASKRARIFRSPRSDPADILGMTGLHSVRYVICFRFGVSMTSKLRLIPMPCTSDAFDPESITQPELKHATGFSWSM